MPSNGESPFRDSDDDDDEPPVSDSYADVPPERDFDYYWSQERTDSPDDPSESAVDQLYLKYKPFIPVRLLKIAVALTFVYLAVFVAGPSADFDATVDDDIEVETNFSSWENANWSNSIPEYNGTGVADGTYDLGVVVSVESGARYTLASELTPRESVYVAGGVNTAPSRNVEMGSLGHATPGDFGLANTSANRTCMRAWGDEARAMTADTYLRRNATVIGLNQSLFREGDYGGAPPTPTPTATPTPVQTATATDDGELSGSDIANYPSRDGSAIRVLMVGGNLNSTLSYQLAKRGYAVVEYPKVLDNETVAVEQEAKASDRGVWGCPVGPDGERYTATPEPSPTPTAARAETETGS